MTHISSVSHYQIHFVGENYKPDTSEKISNKLLSLRRSMGGHTVTVIDQKQFKDHPTIPKIQRVLVGFVFVVLFPITLPLTLLGYLILKLSDSHKKTCEAYRQAHGSHQKTPSRTKSDSTSEKSTSENETKTKKAEFEEVRKEWVGWVLKPDSERCASVLYIAGQAFSDCGRQHKELFKEEWKIVPHYLSCLIKIYYSEWGSSPLNEYQIRDREFVKEIMEYHLTKSAEFSLTFLSPYEYSCFYEQWGSRPEVEQEILRQLRDQPGFRELIVAGLLDPKPPKWGVQTITRKIPIETLKKVLKELEPVVKTHENLKSSIETYAKRDDLTPEEKALLTDFLRKANRLEHPPSSTDNKSTEPFSQTQTPVQNTYDSLVRPQVENQIFVPTETPTLIHIKLNAFMEQFKHIYNSLSDEGKRTFQKNFLKDTEEILKAPASRLKLIIKTEFMAKTQMAWSEEDLQILVDNLDITTLLMIFIRMSKESQQKSFSFIKASPKAMTILTCMQRYYTPTQLDTLAQNGILLD